MRLSERAASAAAEAVGHLLDGGSLRLFAGEPGQTTLLAELRFAAQAFRRGGPGRIEVASIADDPDARATGRAAFFQAVMADGRTVVLEGSVGLSDADLALEPADIERGARVRVTAFTYFQPRNQED